jgi:hypothetical protein
VTRAEVYTAAEEAARTALRWEGPLPEGDLSHVLDSLQRLTLAVAIEDRFEICLDEDAERSIATFDDLVDTVMGAMEGGPDDAS